MWLILTTNGILCANRRAVTPSTPSVEATALHPPSIASSTIFAGSKYAGFGREGGGGRVLDPLVDRQDREVTGTAEAAVVVDALQVDQHPRVAVALGEDAVDVRRAGQLQLLLGNALAGVAQQALRLIAEQFLDAVDTRAFHDGHISLLR